MRLHEYARAGDLAGVTRELDSQVGIDARDGASDRTALMEAVESSNAGIEMVRVLVERGADLSVRDRWGRTPWLLSVRAGQLEKARLLMEIGADYTELGPRGQVALAYAVESGHPAMVRWLLAEGFDPNEADEYRTTPLMEAVRSGSLDCVRLLLDAGADPSSVNQFGETALERVQSAEMARLLINWGADLTQAGPETRALLTGLPRDGKIDVSRAEYLATKHRRFGQRNPELMNMPFWRAMVTSGASAYAARRQFDDTGSLSSGAVWCFERFGMSITLLPDGRIVEIAGEHEDHYDPDFCIYNDVIVHHPDRTFEIYAYPEDLFPPTDFHSATLVGDAIYIIGSLGYQGRRRFGETPVYRLLVDTWEIAHVPTTGDGPGWVNRHVVTAHDDREIRITTGSVSVLVGGKEQVVGFPGEYVLDLTTLAWRHEVTPDVSARRSRTSG